jgi:DNA-binding transcriptional regulator YdaS (Cro superfamily)
MEQLKTHLRAQGIKFGDFADTLGLSKSYFSEILNGIKNVSLKTAFDIERETGGAVTARSLLDQAEAVEK